MSDVASAQEKMRIRAEFERLQREYRNMEATRKVRPVCGPMCALAPRLTPALLRARFLALALPAAGVR